MQKKNDQKLKGKDFIVLGIYGILSYVVAFVVAMILMPFVNVAFPWIYGAACMFSAPVYMLMSFKVAKRGTMILFCSVTGIIGLIMGQVFTFVFMLAAGIVCEAVMWKPGAYRNFRHNTLGYCVYSIFYIGNVMVPIYIFGKDYFSGTESSEALSEVFIKYALTPSWAIITVLSVVVMAFLGCLIGRRLLKKHFIKAGIVMGSTNS